MFLLVRDVSAYTEWNPILLGIFTDENEANAARDQYIAEATASDPWREQAYKKPDLNIDVRVAAVETHTPTEAPPSIFLVTRHLESMGQFSRWYLALYFALSDALARAAKEEAEEKVVAEYISVEEFFLNDRRYFQYSFLPFTQFGTGLWEPPYEPT